MTREQVQLLIKKPLPLPGFEPRTTTGIWFRSLDLRPLDQPAVIIKYFTNNKKSIGKGSFIAYVFLLP
jgi:hypothetical protein